MTLGLGWVREWEEDIPENPQMNAQLVRASVGTAPVHTGQFGVYLQAKGMAMLCYQCCSTRNR